MTKLFDYITAATAYFLLSPIMVIAAILIKIDSEGPVFFKQARVGKGYSEFNIYKFRTMTHKRKNTGLSITSGDDKRITRIGRLLRKSKIDELPQLLNVCKGEMGLVGPRPEVKKYTDIYRNDYEKILQIKPGITDIASMKYRNEEDLLKKQADPEDYYIKIHLPKKIKLAINYIDNKNFSYDINIIVKTLLKIIKSN